MLHFWNTELIVRSGGEEVPSSGSGWSLVGLIHEGASRRAKLRPYAGSEETPPPEPSGSFASYRRPSAARSRAESIQSHRGVRHCTAALTSPRLRLGRCAPTTTLAAQSRRLALQNKGRRWYDASEAGSGDRIPKTQRLSAFHPFPILEWVSKVARPSRARIRTGRPIGSVHRGRRWPYGSPFATGYERVPK